MSSQRWIVVSFCVAVLCQCIRAQVQSNTPAPFCGQPPVLLNAKVEGGGQTEGSVATYTCNDGYLPSGSLETICRNGMWTYTGSPPFCQEQYCPSAPTVRHASSSASFGSRHAVGTVITYTCFTGYSLTSQTSQLECQPNKTWSAPTPTCAPIDCGPPPFVMNSNVSIGNTTYGSSVVYRCHSGYDLLNTNQFGNRNPESISVTCNFRGQWGNAPECNPVDCGPPPSIKFGYKVFGSRHLYSDVVVYGCQLGYSLVGNETSSCLASGKWSPPPECVVVKCNNPPTVANGTITSTHIVNYGNSSYYHCNEGFYMSGFSHVTCKADGSWTDPPQCNIMDCHAPPSILFGKVSFTSTTYKSTVTYSCDKGYKLIGVSEVACLADGKWNEAPACESPVAVGAPAASRSVKSVADYSATIASLAVAVAVMGAITLFFLVFFFLKVYPNKSALFSYAKYKNGDDTINASI